MKMDVRSWREYTLEEIYDSIYGFNVQEQRNSANYRVLYNVLFNKGLPSSKQKSIFEIWPLELIDGTKKLNSSNTFYNILQDRERLIELLSDKNEWGYTCPDWERVDHVSLKRIATIHYSYVKHDKEKLKDRAFALWDKFNIKPAKWLLTEK